ncbi:MAG: GNAT family N-acetyltransferase, partial [Flavobacteriaceae bacterium]
MLKTTIKRFKALTTNELYAILRLRSEVFVVEQDCVYQDLDDKDKKALHVIGWYGNTIVAYTRVFDVKLYFNEASIGRVVVDQKYRSKGFGIDIMNASIDAIEKHYNQTQIKISAQTYLIKFYNNLGFKVQGKPYLEDGIP